jgi:hypothetical protein
VEKRYQAHTTREVCPRPARQSKTFITRGEAESHSDVSFVTGRQEMCKLRQCAAISSRCGCGHVCG